MASKKIESVLKNPPTKKNLGLDDFTSKFYHIFNDDIIQMFFKTLLEN